MSTIKAYFLPTLFAILLHALALFFLSDFWGPSKSINAETFEPKVVLAKLITIERSRTQKKPKPEQAKVMINERKATMSSSSPEKKRTNLPLEEVKLSEVSRTRRRYCRNKISKRQKKKKNSENLFVTISHEF